LEMDRKRALQSAALTASMADTRDERVLGLVEGQAAQAEAYESDAIRNMTLAEQLARRSLAGLREEMESAQKGVATRLQGVMSALSTDETEVGSTVKKDEAELKQQTAIVQRAVLNFLRLWDEYSRVQGGKLKKFHVIDEEFVSDLDVQMRRQVNAAEDLVQKALARVEGVSGRVAPALEDLHSWTSFMDETISSLKDSQLELMQHRDRVLEQFHKGLDTLEVKEKGADAAQMEEIAAMMDVMQQEAEAQAKAALDQRYG
jgi:hypothetical protein